MRLSVADQATSRVDAAGGGSVSGPRLARHQHVIAPQSPLPPHCQTGDLEITATPQRQTPRTRRSGCRRNGKHRAPAAAGELFSLTSERPQ